MDKAELLKNRLQASIDFAEKMNEDLDSASWNYQEGVLLSCNEAKLVIELINKLPIHNVVNQRELLTTFREWWWGNREDISNITNDDLDRYFGG